MSSILDEIEDVLRTCNKATAEDSPREFLAWLGAAEYVRRCLRRARDHEQAHPEDNIMQSPDVSRMISMTILITKKGLTISGG